MLHLVFCPVGWYILLLEGHFNWWIFINCYYFFSTRGEPMTYLKENEWLTLGSLFAYALGTSHLPKPYQWVTLLIFFGSGSGVNYFFHDAVLRTKASPTSNSCVSCGAGSWAGGCSAAHITSLISLIGCLPRLPNIMTMCHLHTMPLHVISKMYHHHKISFCCMYCRKLTATIYFQCTICSHSGIRMHLTNRMEPHCPQCAEIHLFLQILLLLVQMCYSCSSRQPVVVSHCSFDSTSSFNLLHRMTASSRGNRKTTTANLTMFMMLIFTAVGEHFLFIRMWLVDSPSRFIALQKYSPESDWTDQRTSSCW